MLRVKQEWKLKIIEYQTECDYYAAAEKYVIDNPFSMDTS